MKINLAKVTGRLTQFFLILSLLAMFLLLLVSMWAQLEGIIPLWVMLVGLLAISTGMASTGMVISNINDEIKEM